MINRLSAMEFQRHMELENSDKLSSYESEQ